MLPRIKGGFFLDVFAGIHAPISAAADRLEAFDLDANSEHDILDALNSCAYPCQVSSA